MTKRKDLELVDLLTPKGGYRVPVGKYADRWPIEKIADGRWNYGKLYDERAIEYIAALAKERIEHKFDCILLMTGERGTGKSTLAIEINQAVSDGLTLDDIAFPLSEFFDCMDRAPYAKPHEGLYPRIIPDETGIGFYAKQWNNALQKEGVKILEVLRLKGIIITFCAPHTKKINTDIREEMAYIWINTDPPKYLHEDRGYAVVRTGTRDIFKQSIWWFPAFAFFFPELKGPFWEGYEQKKKRFIDMTTAAQSSRYEEKRSKSPMFPTNRTILAE